MNVLIIEDSSSFRDIIKYNLEKEGYTVIGEAEDGVIPCMAKR